MRTRLPGWASLTSPAHREGERHKPFRGRCKRFSDMLGDLFAQEDSYEADGEVRGGNPAFNKVSMKFHTLQALLAFYDSMPIFADEETTAAA